VASAPSFGQQFIQGAIQGLGFGNGRTFQKSWQHASQLIVSDNFRLSPKYGFLYHVSFDINPQIQERFLSNTNIMEAGMLVKAAQLPKFTVENKTYNAYNRVNIVQSKIKYDPLSITFHDDSADVIRNFWFNYYHYYYRDSDHQANDFTQNTKYAQRQYQNWGYTPRVTPPTGSPDRVINAITIYCFHQKQFSEYVLMNPTITGFKFGDPASGETTNTLEAQMTVAYEAVMYGSGQVVPGATINGGFGTLHYDKDPSPLTVQGGGTQSLFGIGGLADSTSTAIDLLGQGNLFGAAQVAFQTAKNFKGTNLGQMGITELNNMAQNSLNGNNPLARIQIPSIGGSVNNPGSLLAGGGILGGVTALFSGRSGPTQLAPQNSQYAAGPNGSPATFYASGIGNMNTAALAPNGPNSATSIPSGAVTSNGDGVATSFPVSIPGALSPTDLPATASSPFVNETPDQAALRIKAQYALAYGSDTTDYTTNVAPAVEQGSPVDPGYTQSSTAF